MTLSLEKVNLIKILKGHKTLILNLAWAPNGKILATAGLDGLIRLWDMEEAGKEASILEGYTNFALCLCWGPDNRSLAVGTHQKTVDIWDIGERKIRTSLKNHRDSINTLSWSFDGKWVASGSYDGEIKIWNLSSPDPIKTLRVDESFIQVVLFSNDSKLLVAGSRDGKIKLWSTQTFQSMETIYTRSRGVYSLAWSGNDRSLVAGCGNGDVIVKDIETGESKTLKGHHDVVTGLSFHSGLNILASKSKDHSIRIWDYGLFKEIFVIDATHSGYNQANLSFHPDKPILACLADEEKRVYIWELIFLK